MKYTSCLFVVFFVCFSAFSKASNRDQFDYLSISVNKPSYDDLNFTPNLDQAALSPYLQSMDSEKLGFRLFYGYQFNRFLAVETGFDYFGANDFSLYQEVAGANNTVTRKNLLSGSFKSLGADVRAVATYPVTNNFYLKANIGALAWRSEQDIVSKTGEEFSLTDNSESGVSLVTGIGMAYGYRKFVAISLDIERTEIADITATNIGLSFTFRI